MPIVWSDCPTYALLVEILQFNLDHCQAEISLYCGHHSVILLSDWLTSPHTSLIGQMSCTLLVYQSVKHSSLSGLNSTVASGQLFSYFLRMTTWRSSILIVTTAWLPQYRNGTEGSHLFPLRNDWLLLQSSAGWDWIYEPGRYYYLQHFSITDMFYFTHKYLPVGPRCLDKQDRTPATWPNQDWVNLCESDGIFCQQNLVKFCPEVDTGPVSSVWRRWRL